MPVNDQPIIRRATRNDTPLIARTIWLAEHTGIELYSYGSLFDLSYETFIKRFSELLKNDEPGHGLTWKSFWIAEINHEAAGCVALYREGENGSSSLLMTGLLMEHFTRQEVASAFAKLEAFRSVHIVQTNGNYQLDSGATFAPHHGKRIFGSIFNHAYKELSMEHPAVVEAQVWMKNDHAKKVYVGLGFIERYQKEYNASGMGRLLMTKEPIQ